ncbi:MAG TPA: polysaccharide deacetylase family protein [Candidatus Saccharimonadales bacterium]|jgi:peptidoglycan/xylan/chitin deacetylase (PgdA/CDA1 family)|nr:polysaccharide deacetylase family protein [Candidatus Saccharimonadales bacterium]
MPESEVARKTASGIPPTGRQTPLLTYHELAAGPSQDLYRVEAVRFAQHLETLTALYRSGTLPSADWRLSFDDGHRSNAELALPLLQKSGLKAIFFITAGWTGARSSAMTWSQLEDLVRSGHSVQSHAWSHEFLTGCSSSQLDYELRHSRRTLEDRLGIGVDSISVPGGRWSATVLKACAEVGYQHVYTSDPMFEPAYEHGVWRYGRLMVRRDTQAEELHQFLTGNRRYWSKLHTRRRLKEACKAMLGDARYHSLWRRLSGRRKTEQMDSGQPTRAAETSNHAHTATD